MQIERAIVGVVLCALRRIIYYYYIVSAIFVLFIRKYCSSELKYGDLVIYKLTTNA